MNITKQIILEKQNISEDLVQLIKQQILDGELNPGDRIIETKFAKDLGISQTPVREAIRLLSGEGIVTIVPNKGPLVRAFHMKDVFEVYSLRAVYEGLAIRLAVKNASDEDIRHLQEFYESMEAKLNDNSVPSLLKDSLYIHQSIISLSRHERLIHMYKTISFQIALVNRMLGSTSTKQKEVEQHWELIDALNRRDADYAEGIMRAHIHRSYREFADMKEIDNSSFDDSAWF
ncbi:GntR family transcriptional regulator [Paenibacillus sp. LHD-117]|uniref:GntR family transcriptional regulator n=1 Tax=Paenibacillus sp. LHD-117 TaxID=3071412 RepID=UPI0027DF2E9B|nr:GntR family transcriptional regulator [Paenibacillus sp. LHD-117]MDQ6419724.1 GntR family transcriptional regulator [Paenibacillus sp. LHD-117]